MTDTPSAPQLTAEELDALEARVVADDVWRVGRRDMHRLLSMARDALALKEAAQEVVDSCDAGQALQIGTSENYLVTHCVSAPAAIAALRNALVATRATAGTQEGTE